MQSNDLRRIKKIANYFSNLFDCNKNYISRSN